MANQQVNQRVVRELLDIQKGSDLSLAVAFGDSDFRHVKAFIIGAPETPYEFGFFEFKVTFPTEYPSKAPKVVATTTNGGSTRFNPNIYAEGKVCLSILGTWHGEPGEQWSSAQCLESVLISIQSLMSSNPFQNEPGFEKTKFDDAEALSYAAKIHHETLRITVIQRLEQYLGVKDPERREEQKPTMVLFGADEEDKEDDLLPEPFVDLCKRRFLWYYPSYLQSIEDAVNKRGKLVADGVPFEDAAFEHGGNRMEGSYNYTNLKKRLQNIRHLLDQESTDWIAQGKAALTNENPRALAMQNTFAALVQQFKKSHKQLHLELADGNPFTWRLVVFGAPMTNLDGGIFTTTLVFPTSFPDAQPRATVSTPLFHHHVATDGTLCYFAHKPNDIASHLEGVVAAIVEPDEPRYDPRAVVNPEASKLYWGDAEQRKLYNRKLRRSAQESAE